ncbi:MAG: amidohydrolase [Firmicutes bacterium]|nr:amidohydrolase [Bacillota bacterium]
MDQFKENAKKQVEAKKDVILDVSHKVWDFAELSLKEYKSAALYVEVLKNEGFETEEGLCGIDTAFLGKFGSGRPWIGILGEFDALSGLSQKAGLDHPEALVPGGDGHGCGHNMLGAASLGAAIGVKKYLEETGKSGTVFFYGCPGEEGGASKALMARDGVWNDLDAAITWHPGDTFSVSTGTDNSCIQYIYSFKGISSHAAGSPEKGRSALDAVELMNMGVQFLREHVPSDARIHYAIINAGGKSPNVVQATADVLYMIRSTKVADAVALTKRVDKIAQGAALMTETELSTIFVDGCANSVPNTTLEKLLYKNMEETPLPEYSPEDWALAEAIKKTCPPRTELPGMGAKYDKKIAEIVKEKSQDGTRAINDFLLPFYTGDDFSAGSSDVGDVSWNIPTAQISAVTWPSGTPGHSWQNVSCGASPIGDKGTLYAAKVMCGAVIDLINEPEIIKEAKAELKKRAPEGYTCPVPEGAKLYVID